MLAPTPRPPTIVLVDDDSALRMALTFALELEGFQVEAFESGEALLKHSMPKPPACMILDMNLSGINGIETLATLRARGNILRALLITSFAKSDVRAAAEALGAVVVDKPLLGDNLSIEISKALRSAPGSIETGC